MAPVAASSDAMISNMREARHSPAVNKAKLASMRSEGVSGIVFVCEGVDDKRVYFHWLRSLQKPDKFEFLVCNGKRRVLELRSLLSRDLSGLAKDVYYLVDRDYDNLCGFDSGPDLYMTDCYSIENELVCDEVLHRVLAIDLHCDSLQLRLTVVSKFSEIYQRFLEVTRPHNEMIFLARRLGIPTKPLPDKASKLSIVGLQEVLPHVDAVFEVIKLEREPSVEEIACYSNEFSGLDARKRYRGKFALSFFVNWLQLLACDRESDASYFFSGYPKSSARVMKQFDLDSIASKSNVPLSFCAFIHAIT